MPPALDASSFPAIGTESSAIEGSASPVPAASAAGIGVACLSSHNSDNHREKLSSKARKRAHSITQNVTAFVKKYGVEKCGFMTCTTGEQIDASEFGRRVKNFHDRVLRPVVIDAITVAEWTKRGIPHQHKLVALKVDIREGFDFAHYEALIAWNRRYQDPERGPRPQGHLGRNAELVALHQLLNTRRKGYGLGTIELTPIRSNAEAIGFYLGGYLAKSLAHKPAGNRSRLVRYTQGCPRPVKGDFMWLGPGSWIWRRKLMLWAKSHGCNSLDDVKQLFGARWAYHHRKNIEGMELDIYPDLGIWTIERGTFDAPPADCFPVTCTKGDGSAIHYRALPSCADLYRRWHEAEGLRNLNAIYAEQQARRGFEATLTAPHTEPSNTVTPLPCGGGKAEPSPSGDEHLPSKTAPLEGRGGRSFTLRPRPPIVPLQKRLVLTGAC